MKTPLNEPFSIFWFRRDLRIKDNHGLNQALLADLPVVPIFIFDTNILEHLPKKDARLEFIHSRLAHLQSEIEKHHSSLDVHVGRALEVWKTILKAYPVKKVFVNEDYEPYARQRDAAVAKLCATHGVEFHQFKDQVVFGPLEILKDNGEPYRVYTPFSKRWLATVTASHLSGYSSEKKLNKLASFSRGLPDLNQLGFEPSGIPIPEAVLRMKILADYARTRDIPGIQGTSRLGIHLRFGSLSIRELTKRAQGVSLIFLKELIWREFFMQILFHYPHSATSSFDPRYDAIEWVNNKKHFAAWCEGRTGYPMVDAGMRELNSTGFMHNRVRMVTASFLCKHLLIDWRWGERYFAEKLLDYDLSANVGNWQWAAGSGCDAAPYFRVFNPALQAKKFDPKELYIKKWVPELGQSDYPEPIVNHEVARAKALATYKVALKGNAK